MKEWLVSYLTFSKKERMAVVVLLSLILFIWLLPKYYLQAEQADAGILARADSVMALKKDETTAADREKTVFYFDPNTISDADWEKLGLEKRTISTIRNYLSKGGRFREASDLEKIYGMHREDADRLIPYVRIRQNGKDRDRFARPYVSYRSLYQHSTNSSFGAGGYRKDQIKYGSSSPPTGVVERREGFGNPSGHFDRAFVFRNTNRKERSMTVLELNEADSIELEALPGIGVKLASRIVRFRESLGGFYSIEQLRDVYGVNDSLYQFILQFLKLNPGIYRKIRINSWNADSLDLHPYIQRHEARAIVKYRELHGPFEGKESLRAISILTEEWVKRLEPYLEYER